MNKYFLSLCSFRNYASIYISSTTPSIFTTIFVFRKSFSYDKLITLHIQLGIQFAYPIWMHWLLQQFNFYISWSLYFYKVIILKFSLQRFSTSLLRIFSNKKLWAPTNFVYISTPFPLIDEFGAAKNVNIRV